MVGDNNNNKRDQKKDIRQTPPDQSRIRTALAKDITPWQTTPNGALTARTHYRPMTTTTKTNADHPGQGQHKQKQGGIVAQMQIYYENLTNMSPSARFSISPISTGQNPSNLRPENITWRTQIRTKKGENAQTT